MTLEEAKEFYFRYYGSSFHMDREEPAKYNSLMMLGLGADTFRAWDEELLDGLFEGLWSDSERVWIAHGRILQIIRRNNCDADECLRRLLDEMEKMNCLDVPNLTLIIENMAGRNEAMSDGGVYVFGKHPILAARMDDIVERLIAVGSAHPEADDRLEKAVRRYRSAYGKWCASAAGFPGR